MPKCGTTKSQKLSVPNNNSQHCENLMHIRMQYCDNWPTAAVAAAGLGQSFMVIAVSVLVKLVLSFVTWLVWN
jgi:hypothetical protein